MGQEIKTKKVLDYESTLEIADLLLKKDLKLIKKTTRYYQLKVFNSNTRRARQVLLCKFKDCGKKFSRKCGLKDHLLIHEEIKPFKCGLCSKYFTQQGNRDIHQRSCARRL